MTERNETWFKRNLFAILATALQLMAWGVYIGRQETIISNQEQRLAAVELKVDAHHQDQNLHTNGEWRAAVLTALGRLEGKVDGHIMRDDK